MGRNHPFVEALAEHLVDLAFHPAEPQGPASRCGTVRTDQVQRRTTLLLLRLRYLQHEGQDDRPTLAEETLVWGFQGSPPSLCPLSPDDARRLMDEARAVANVPQGERQEVVREALSWWPQLQPALEALLQQRARELELAHERIRQASGRAKPRLEPQTPPDLLGLLVLLPVPAGVRA